MEINKTEEDIKWQREYKRKKEPTKQQWQEFYNFLKENNFEKRLCFFKKFSIELPALWIVWKHKPTGIFFYRNYFMGYNYLVKINDFELFCSNTNFKIEEWKNKVLDTIDFLNKEAQK